MEANMKPVYNMHYICNIFYVFTVRFTNHCDLVFFLKVQWKKITASVHQILNQRKCSKHSKHFNNNEHFYTLFQCSEHFTEMIDYTHILINRHAHFCNRHAYLYIRYVHTSWTPITVENKNKEILQLHLSLSCFFFNFFAAFSIGSNCIDKKFKQYWLHLSDLFTLMSLIIIIKKCKNF